MGACNTKTAESETRISGPLSADSINVTLKADPVVAEEATAAVEAETPAAPATCPYSSMAVTSPALAICPHLLPVAATPSAVREAGPASAWPRAGDNATLKPLSMKRSQECVADLLREHAAAIAELRAALADEPLLAQYDDLFVLRFVLSNGKSAEEPLRQTLRWRDANAEMLARAGRGEPHPKNKEMGFYSIADLIPTRTLSDEPVMVVRAGRSRVKTLMDKFTEEEVVDWLNYPKEWAFQICDEATRRTGRLVKMVTVVDMHSSRLSDNDKRFYKALGGASKDAEVYYPQLLSMTVPINTPSFLNILWVFAKRLLPKKTIEKMRLCGARDTLKQPATKCPWVTYNFAPEDLPDFLGGTAPPTEMLMRIPPVP